MECLVGRKWTRDFRGLRGEETLLEGFRVTFVSTMDADPGTNISVQVCVTCVSVNVLLVPVYVYVGYLSDFEVSILSFF